MNKITICLLLALQACLPGIACAAGDPSLQPCLDMQNKGESDQALACYKQAAQAQAQPAASAPEPHPFLGAPVRNLADEWAPSATPLNIYKENYAQFYSHLSGTNNAPSSPNPVNRVPFAYEDSKEIKYQFSLKSHLAGGANHTVWFGYTQVSFWQAYDKVNSRPFRETNYEPELIYSYRPEHLTLGATTFSFLNAALVHQSNGQSLPRSRSWNRAYAQAGFETRLTEHQRLALLLRYWKRLDGGGPDDDNPDITTYLGHGDIEARYYFGQGMLSALARIRSIQIDAALPLLALGIRHTNLHLQYFHGYGESLIDYNQKHTTLGIGISVPFE